VNPTTRHADPETLVGLPPNRIETLVDGIFAVAMTILVLELHVPELARQLSDAALAEALLHLLPRILSYAVGFVILGTLWVGHHYQFHYIQRSNRALLWINIVFLLGISFLPFAIGLIGAAGARRLPCIVYGATLLVAGSSLLVQWQYAAVRGRRLVSPTLDAEIISGLYARVLAGMLGYGAGLLLAFFAPVASLVCYAAMPLLYLLPSRIDQHVRAKRS
jgi:uncharacterized membrane protein